MRPVAKARPIAAPVEILLLRLLTQRLPEPRGLRLWRPGEALVDDIRGKSVRGAILQLCIVKTEFHLRIALLVELELYCHRAPAVENCRLEAAARQSR